MSNSFFASEKYPFMNRDQELGVFTVDCDSDGNYKYTLDLFNGIDKELIPWAFKDTEDNFIFFKEKPEIHNAVVLSWLEERVFPPERQNADELLDRLGLEEYDQLSIIKSTRASSFLDSYWVKFFKEDSYRDTILSRWGD